MYKQNFIWRLSLVLLLLAFTLAACSTGQPPATQPGAGSQATLPPSAVAPTDLPPATQPSAPTAAATLQPTASSAENPPAGCTITSPRPTPGPTEQSLFPPVSDKDWMQGKSEAPVTIMEYSDFQCPYCAKVAPLLARIVQDNPEVRLVYRHLPLIGTKEQPFHDKAALSAQAAEAAGRQGKFWEMHDLLFAQQNDWAARTPDDFKAWVIEQAVKLGLDKARFSQDLVSKEIVDFVQAAWDHGMAINLVSTPTLLVDGQLWPNNLPVSYENLTTVIRLTRLEQRQFTACPPQTVDPHKQYIATLKTEKGDIVIELFADKTPLAVNNFVFLARQGWYNDITFHRVLPDFVAQAGDPTGTGFGGPGYAFSNEIVADLKFDVPGLVAMANAGANTNGSQFFITYAPAPKLDGNYTIFGRVIAGMEVAKKLTPRDPQSGGELPPGDKILSVTIEEK